MNIGIIGLGLMGGSIAEALNEKHHLLAYDTEEKSLQYALENGMIDQPCFKLESLFRQAEVVILCLYPQEIIRFVLTHQPLFRPGTVIIEISGIKSALVNILLPQLRKDIDMVFTHPVAGREKVGVHFSSKSIFTGQNFVIVPTAKNKKENLNMVESLAKDMGFGTISRVTPEEHDEIIAYTSQLTHVLSLALIDSDNGKFTTSHFIGDSFRNLTRIAMINESLWSELFLGNSVFLTEKIDSMIESLTKYKDAIQTNNYEKLINLMKKAKKIRMEIEKDVVE